MAEKLDDWPGFETLIRQIKIAPLTMRGAILFAAVESCLDGPFFASPEALQVAVGRCVKNAVTAGLLEQYIDLVNQFGAESDQASEFAAAHAANSEFIELAAAAKQLKAAMSAAR